MSTQTNQIWSSIIAVMMQVTAATNYSGDLHPLHYCCTKLYSFLKYLFVKSYLNINISHLQEMANLKTITHKAIFHAEITSRRPNKKADWNMYFIVLIFIIMLKFQII